MKKRCFSSFLQKWDVGRKILLTMKLTCVLTVFFTISAMGVGIGQTVNLKLKDVTLREAFKALKQQTGMYFVYNEEELSKDLKLSVELENTSLEEALRQILKGLPYSFERVGKMVVVKPVKEVVDQTQQQKKKKVTGKVTDIEGTPLPGVTVMIEGAVSGTATDVKGEYSLELEDKHGRKLVYSFIGMVKVTKVWNGEERIDVQMKEDVHDIEEVVVTGYQTLNRRESASAVSVVKTDDIYMAGAASIDQMLQGQVPGLMVMNTSGEPSATPKIRIRGTSTINGNKAPVWVVDGVILEQNVPITASELNSEDAEYLIGNAISGISPQDIESITVLKDASATAIYGVKAANGVIVLTTKKGRAGKPTVSYYGEVVVNERPSYRNFDRMNSAERMQLSKEIFEQGLSYNSNISLDPADSYEGLLNELINRRMSQEEFALRSKEMANRNTDWFDVLFRNAVTHSHNLSIDGGSEGAKYYFSAGYNNNQGGAKGSVSERFTSVARVDASVGKYVNFTAKIDFSTTKNEGYSVVNPFSYAYNTSRTVQPYDEDGDYHFYKKDSKYKYNVLNELAETGKESKANDFNALLNLNVKLYDGLSYQGTFSYHNSSTNQRDWKTEESASVASIRTYDYKQYDENDDEYWKSPLPYGGVLEQANTLKTGYTVRNGLSFVKILGDVHDMNIIVGSELRGTKYEGVRSTGYGWTPTYGERFMPVQTESFLGSYVSRLYPTNTNSVSRVASFYGSATYTYNNRYVMNFNIRSDGANKFGSNPKYRWLPTWSIAGKWLLTNEAFMSRFAQNGHYVSVRGSYGIQGNIHDDATPNLILEVGDRNTISNLDQSTIYRLPNPDLRWEKTTSWNVAVDFSFWDDRLSGSLDVYKKHTEDLIMDKIVATSNGKSRLYMNAGEMDNQGIEGNLSVQIIRKKNLNWKFNVNFGRNTSEVTLANDDFYSDMEVITKMLDGNLAIKGEKLGSMYSFRYGGLSSENGYPLFYGKDGKLWHKGDPKRMELVRSGSIYPDLSGGFDTQLTFNKRLSLSLGFTYNLGGVKRLPRVYADKGNALNPVANVSTNWKNRWRKPGDEKYTDIPTLYNDRVASDFDRNVSAEDRGAVEDCTYFYDLSDLRVVKADFLRLRTVGLSYIVPENLLKMTGISSMAIRFQASNLFVWAHKDWKGLDPETPEANIPILPSYSLGINVSF